VVNESATERQIRELKEENSRLQDMIKTGGTSGSQVSETSNKTVKKAIQKNGTWNSYYPPSLFN
jgi:rRNA maturation endonuclease Nob1